ncbi:MAG TPA: ABC transporter ATP-binding protein [Gaiellaceae bacterium]|nr:ABC transporter ATP-binding protein [Gaiellaceae bacterium]
MAEGSALSSTAARGAGDPGASPVAAVRMEGITKRFPGVVANEDVRFEAAAGEVHALLGENGAGKTTLSNILTGLYRPDEGEIELYGERVDFHSPRDALDAGICMVHQHFRLVSPFTVAENVVLGDHRAAGRSFLLRRAAIERTVADLARRYGLAVHPRARTWQLSVGEQQRVEILKALYRDARILIMDEPTAVLTPQEAEGLFETLRAMAADGRTVIFISHKLHEVMAVADRVTVLRAGRTVATVSAAEATPRSLAALMVGREIDEARRVDRRAPPGDDVVLSVEGLTVGGDRGGIAVDDVSFTIRAGEIVGVAGVAGNGQRELADAVYGMRDALSGSVGVDSRRLRAGDPRAAIAAGIAHVPEDRLGTGLAPSLPVASNAVLKSYRRRPVSWGPLLVTGRMREAARSIIDRYDVKAPGPDTPARNLSGGNLQKLVLGREFQGSPRVLVAAQPTRGLDVGAIETVHAYLRDAAASGVAVLVISEDLDELRALADRILVMYEGRVVGECDPVRTTVEDIGLLMAGGEHAH